MTPSTTTATPGRFRERNNNWRGGRHVASNGYVKVRVGVGHHLADSAGYAYEHRIVAEEKIGRRLRQGEIVHHVDEDKGNNSPANLEVVPGVAEHRRHHRKPGANLRNPGQENRRLPCACGCGALIAQFDESGRPRRFISGHNGQPSPTMDAIKSLLADASPCALHRRVMVERTGLTIHAVAVALSRLRRAGVAEPVGGGGWALKQFPAEVAA